MEQPDANVFGLALISNFTEGSPFFAEAFDTYIEQMTITNTPIVLISALNTTWQAFEVSFPIMGAVFWSIKILLRLSCYLY